jgi:hypothetical protein
MAVILLVDFLRVHLFSRHCFVLVVAVLGQDRKAMGIQPTKSGGGGEVSATILCFVAPGDNVALCVVLFFLLKNLGAARYAAFCGLK